MRIRWAWICLFAGATGASGQGVEIEASSPQNVAISIYDTGFGLVNELRRLTPARGENVVRFKELPRRLDPGTVSFIPLTGMPGFEVREQQFLFDLDSAGTMLNRFLGRDVEVHTLTGKQRGRLLSAPPSPLVETQHPLALQTGQAADLALIPPDRVQEILFPQAVQQAHVQPTLLWRAEARQEGPQNIRLSYKTDGLRWRATYDVLLDESGEKAQMNARIGIDNQSGGHFQDAQVQLILTERGLLTVQRRSAVTPPRDRMDGASALRYAYGLDEPSFEQAVAGLSPVNSYRLPAPVTLNNGDSRFVQYSHADELAVTRFYVYDGVKFDRFQRHRRNDWNYGTEFHTVVQTHLEFVNEPREGMGADLPPGMLRLYQRRADGTVDFLGEDLLTPTAAGARGHVLLGPARSMRGERERTGYAEITPLRVYEESFQIRLENDSDEEVEIRVVEHLYRWHEFEIVRADTEYVATGPQAIEFRPSLKPGGKRTIHYTVRYSW